jgi:hypothetical protein
LVASGVIVRLVLLWWWLNKLVVGAVVEESPDGGEEPGGFAMMLALDQDRGHQQHAVERVHSSSLDVLLGPPLRALVVRKVLGRRKTMSIAHAHTHAHAHASHRTAHSSEQHKHVQQRAYLAS